MSISESREQSLDGWWHAWFDEQAEWEHITPPDPRTPLGELVHHQPTVGWDHIEEGMESIQVPGTWDVSRPNYRGVVWYWRPLVIPKEWEGRSVWLRFGGVRLASEIYLDDRLVSYDLDGLTSFEIDLTGMVRPGHRHELAVRVVQPGGTRPGAGSRLIAWGETVLPQSHEFGGIWGHVSVCGAPMAHVRDLYVRSSPDLRTAQVVCSVINKGDARRVQLTASLEDADGAIVGSCEEIGRDLAEGEEAEIRVDIPVSEPHPWSPDDPYLYSLRVSLDDGSHIDRVTQSVGLRSFVTGPDGYLLNGQPFHLVAARSEGLYPDNVAAPSARLADEEVRAAKKAGLNALRFDGHVAGDDLLDAADRLGLFVVDWLGGVGTGSGESNLSGDDSVTAWLRATRRKRLVGRGRIHPCVLWSCSPATNPGGPYSVTHDWQRSCDEEVPAPSVCVVNPTPLGLPSPDGLVTRYGDRRIPGSEAAYWHASRRHLEDAFAQHGMGRLFTGVESLVRASNRAAEDALAEAVRDARLSQGCFNVEVGRWADQPGCQLGLVDAFREPKSALRTLAGATDRLMLRLSGLPLVVRAGERHTVSAWLSNWSRESGSLTLQMRLLGPDGRLAVEETGWAMLDGSASQRLGTTPLVTSSGGRYVVQVRLVHRGETLCQTRRSVWSVVPRTPSLRKVSVLGPADAVALTLSRWGVVWEPFRLGSRTRALLITSPEPDGAVANALYAGAVDRVAVLLDGAPTRGRAAGPAWHDLLPSMDSAIRLDGPGEAQGLWLVGGRHTVLDGIGDPGVWAHVSADGIYPHYVLSDVHGKSLVSLCYIGSQAGQTPRRPRIGTVVAEGDLGEAECLWCGLRVLSAAQRGDPLAERLLSNILDWLDGDA